MIVIITHDVVEISVFDVTFTYVLVYGGDSSVIWGASSSDLEALLRIDRINLSCAVSYLRASAVLTLVSSTA